MKLRTALNAIASGTALYFGLVENPQAESFSYSDEIPFTSRTPLSERTILATELYKLINPIFLEDELRNGGAAKVDAYQTSDGKKGRVVTTLSIGKYILLTRDLPIGKGLDYVIFVRSKEGGARVQPLLEWTRGDKSNQVLREVGEKAQEYILKRAGRYQPKIQRRN